MAEASKARNFINDGRTILVEQQVEKDSPRMVKYLKTAAAKRQLDLLPDIAEYLQRYRAGKAGLLFHTANGTPHMLTKRDDAMRGTKVKSQPKRRH
jgi:F0F1-type ATP synthase delta subunit